MEKVETGSRWIPPPDSCVEKSCFLAKEQMQSGLRVFLREREREMAQRPTEPLVHERKIQREHETTI